jgi:hypothetical protein
MGRNLTAERDDWYNLSDDLMYRAPGVDGSRQKAPHEMSSLEKEAYRSFEDCGRACEEHPRCFQFDFQDQTCGFSFSYRLGSRKMGYRSGWNLQKIDMYRSENVCHEPQWL